MAAKKPEPDLCVLLVQLGSDERRVLAYVAERLLMGQRQYGILDIANDKRDWTKELGEEVLDAAVYAALRSLKLGSAA